MKKSLLYFLALFIFGYSAFHIYGWWQSRNGIRQVLFITIDTLRADHLSAYGYPLNTTPFFDSLAEKGVLFERALSVSSHTAPSHTTMFTGIFPYQHRVMANHDRLPIDVPNMHTALTAGGFDVVGFPAVSFMEGKVGFPEIPVDQDLPGSEVSRKYWFRSAATQVDRVIHWFKNRTKQEPFFVWLHFYDVHAWQHRDPGQVPKEYFPQMMPQNMDEHAEFLMREHAIPESWYKSRKHMVTAIHRYDARLRYVDDQIKRLSEFMNSQNLWEDTLVVITADHGEGLGNHNYAGHGMYIYNEQLHVPLLVSRPNGKLNPQRIAHQVRTVDLFPTVVDLVGLEMPSPTIPYQGQSLKPVILAAPDAANKLHEFSFAERRPKDETRLRRGWKEGDFHALQNAKWKLILHSLGEHELYNLEEDRFELNNVLKDNPEVMERYRSIIEALLKLPSAGDGAPEQLNDTQLEELRSLGYL